MIKKLSLVFLACGVPFSAFGMNLLLRPWDTLIRPEVYLDRCAELSLWAEAGIIPARGYNQDGARVNPLTIWNPDQDALAMLDGFPVNSPITQLRTVLNATDDGIRGHLIFDGKLNLDFGGAIGARWYFLPHAWFMAYVPFYKVRLTDVAFTDLTQLKTAADYRVRNMFINNLNTIVSQLSDGLTIGGWKRTGAGDLNIMVEWLYNFQQERPLLKNVELDGRVGFTLPTGLKADPDLLFAFPFGYDGAVGILYGGGLNVLLGDRLKAGFDVQLFHLFGNTRPRRIKTAFDQTELLLLAKTDAYIDYGLTQRFNLFIQAYHVCGGLSFLAGYQFLKRGENHLALNSCEFSTSIANTAISLEEWIVHSVELNLHYDFSVHSCDDSWAVPQLSLFSRIPFNGKRAIAFTTVGIMAAVDF